MPRGTLGSATALLLALSCQPPEPPAVVPEAAAQAAPPAPRVATATPAASAAASPPVPAAEPGPLPLSDADREGGCREIAAALCEELAQCLPGGLFAISYVDAADCVAAETTECLDETLPAGTTRTRANAALCAAAIRAAGCGGDTSEACRLPGWRADGEACSVSGQCASGSCRGAGDDGCGTCQPRQTRALGAPCERSCGELACADGRCVERAAIGAACDGDLCVEGAVCVQGSCRARAALGRPCDGLNETAPDCADGLICPLRFTAMGDMLPSQCAKIERRLVSESCAGPTQICVRSWCHEDVCAAGVPAGGACDHRDHRRERCAEGLGCFAGRCASRGSLSCGG